ERVVEPMLRARDALRSEYLTLHRAVLAIVREDAVCRRLMTVPGVGALVAITFTSAVDDPARFRHSRDVGAHFGLTPQKYQSGECGAGRVGSAPLRSRRRDAGPARPLIGEWRRLGGDHAPLDWPAGSPLTAWCGGPRADHGRKHEPGGRMVTRGA